MASLLESFPELAQLNPVCEAPRPFRFVAAANETDGMTQQIARL